MTTSIHHGSAKIYQFPVKNRATVDGHRDSVTPATLPTSQRISGAAFGDGWYHEEAVQDAERARKKLHRFPTR